MQVREMASEQSHQVHSHEARFLRESANPLLLTELVVLTWVSFLHLNYVHVLLLQVHVVIINDSCTAQLQSWEAS